MWQWSGAILVVLALGWAAPAQAVQTRGWEEGAAGEPLSMKTLIPRMSGEESYSERYTFAAELEGGGFLKFEFTISNFGFGDHHGAAAVTVDLPGRETYEFSRKVGDWSYTKDRFSLSIARTTIEEDGEQAFRLRHRAKGMEVDVRFENTIPMWQPGNGEIRSGGKYFTLHLVAPRADVTGTIATGDQTIPVDAPQAGFGDHSATQFAPYDLARRFSRFHHFNDDLFVAWREIALTEARGDSSLTWIVVGYKDEIIFSDASAQITFRDIVRDSETGYRVPRQIQIEGQSGLDSVRLVIEGKNLRRKSLLDEYGALIRTLASAVTDPYQYAMDGEYKLQMTIQDATATVEGTVGFSMDYLN